MPHTIKMDKKLRKQGLNSVLVHVQDDPVDLTGFVFKNFPSNDVMVTADNPLLIGKSRDLKLPMAALISCDGTILAVGHRNEVGRDIAKMIPKELARLKKGWGADETITKARALIHGQEKFAAAHELLNGYQPTDDAVAADLKKAKAELTQRLETCMRSIEYLMKAGRWIEAQDRHKALTKAVKGLTSHEEKVATLGKRFTEPRGVFELKYSKKIEKIIRAAKKGIKNDMPDKLRKIVKGQNALTVWRRAQRYASIWDRL